MPQCTIYLCTIQCTIYLKKDCFYWIDFFLFCHFGSAKQIGPIFDKLAKVGESSSLSEVLHNKGLDKVDDRCDGEGVDRIEEGVICCNGKNAGPCITKGVIG